MGRYRWSDDPRYRHQRWWLQVDTSTGAAGAAPLTTGANEVDTGTYYVSETGGLADYTSELDCTRNGDDFTPGIDGEVTVGAEDVVVCAFTNTRKEGSIELKKKWVGTGGQTTLDIGTTVGGSEVDTQYRRRRRSPADDRCQRGRHGTYYVSETGGLADYTSELDCTRSGDDFTPGIDGEVTVGAEDRRRLQIHQHPQGRLDRAEEEVGRYRWSDDPRYRHHRWWLRGRHAVPAPPAQPR